MRKTPIIVAAVTSACQGTCMRGSLGSRDDAEARQMTGVNVG